MGASNLPALHRFVCAVSFFQPQSQSYPGANGGATFPASHGQTASFFQNDGVQQEFAFIPDDGSMTYVINVENNSNQQGCQGTLDSTGSVSFIPYKQGDASTNSAAKWASVAKIAAVAPAASSGSSAGTGTGASATGASGVGTAPAGTRLPASGTSSSGGASSTGGAAADNGAFTNAASFGGLASALLAALAFLQ